jgi:hypothetical protein
VNIEDVKTILERIIGRTERLIAAGRRQEILNERFFHHMFSWEVGKLLESRNEDLWGSLFLAPEAKTRLKFRRKGIKVGDAEFTKANAIDTGRSGNLDFVLKAQPLICVEWKGPKLFTASSALEVLLKLLKQPQEATKVFAAVVTSCTSGGRGHVTTAKKYLDLALKDARDIQGCTSLRGSNIFGFIASFAGTMLHRLHWGELE